MFTGIIEDLGEIKKISRSGKMTLIQVTSGKVVEDTKIGDSIAVNGACLTVVRVDGQDLSFEAMPETLKVTNLGALRLKERVNLERALKLGDRISGHFVSGHVDCLGLIRHKRIKQNNLCFEISASQQYLKYCLAKGSIAVDGISLTVMEKISSSFSVYLIPHTFEHTTLGFKGPSDKVNLEFDMLLKKV